MATTDPKRGPLLMMVGGMVLELGGIGALLFGLGVVGPEAGSGAATAVGVATIVLANGLLLLGVLGLKRVQGGRGD